MSAKTTSPVRLFVLTVCWVLLATPSMADEGWHATLEHLLLAPKISDNSATNIFYYGDNPSSTFEQGGIESKINYSQRLILGYEGSAGGGAQVRWFTFDQDLNYTGVVNEGPLIALSGGLNLDVDALDAELTHRGDFGVWDWTASAGARYGRLSMREEDINFEDLTDTIWFGRTGVQFEGAGPTISVGGERQLGNSGANFFARGRASLLFGDAKLWSAFRNGGIYTIAEESVLTWELQMGTQVERRLRRCDLLAGIFWEAQKWDSDSDLLGDVGFHGFGITTGIRY